MLRGIVVSTMTPIGQTSLVVIGDGGASEWHGADCARAIGAARSQPEDRPRSHEREEDGKRPDE